MTAGVDAVETVTEYLDRQDWRVNANPNQSAGAAPPRAAGGWGVAPGGGGA
ncbi:hypothetical protein OTB20_20830 [Streptomyces sp. H27-H1]|uniref:hypothetical protein n=1 Tax=Streptomyces sp. H27-H1 TaxID=2996461 RepID=UPI0022700C03|nr:hypothetical protein [Streptomyces sp. H27-H1]MCY0928604.1 hypothetical protein [Streptomyces sp. H27-H1]